MLRKEDRLPPEQQEEYVLLDAPAYKHYQQWYEWKPGDRLRRLSIWLSGNGCGVRQAYFEHVDRPGRDGTVWEDHVKPVNGQLEFDV